MTKPGDPGKKPLAKRGGYEPGPKTVSELAPPPKVPGAGAKPLSGLSGGRSIEATDLMERLGRALERSALDQRQAARMLGTSPRTVSRWLRRKADPCPEARERVLELLAILELLSNALPPQAAHDWLFTPNPLLSHHKPADLIQQGRYRELLGAVDQLAEGTFV